MNTDFLNGLPVELDITFRLVLAYLLGGVIGWEREISGQSAGLRTHLMVVSGAAAFTLAFIFGFKGLGTTSDVARSASQIIVGVGFLGAGAIWQSRDPERRRGLTTAADIWVVAAIGMLSAVGMWYTAILLTGLAFVTLHLLKPFRDAIDQQRKRKTIQNPLQPPETPED